MFENIEELGKEIDEFKMNINGTNDLIKRILEISEKIEVSKEELNSKYSLFLNEMEKSNNGNKAQSDKLIQTVNKELQESVEELNSKYSLFLKDIQEISSTGKKLNYQMLQDVTNYIKGEQIIFEKSITNFIERLDNLQLEPIQKSVEKMNGKINLIFISIGILIILNISFIIIK